MDGGIQLERSVYVWRSIVALVSRGASHLLPPPPPVLLSPWEREGSHSGSPAVEERRDGGSTGVLLGCPSYKIFRHRVMVAAALLTLRSDAALTLRLETGEEAAGLRWRGLVVLHAGDEKYFPYDVGERSPLRGEEVHPSLASQGVSAEAGEGGSGGGGPLPLALPASAG